MSKMPPTHSTSPRYRRYLFLAAAALQLGCGLVFASDVISEFNERTYHTWIEITGIIALSTGAAITLRQYRQLLQRNTKIERELGVASGAFQEILEQHFDMWHLTNAERDVALLSIKGLPIADIATMRQTREGTIKAQSAAIYRKSGVANRAELISVVIEELIAGVERPDPETEQAASVQIDRQTALSPRI